MPLRTGRWLRQRATEPPTAFQLTNAMHHVNYELDMMAFAAARLRYPLDDLFRNAYLESMLLHARNLAAFLIWPDNNATSIRPVDFAPGWSAGPAEACAYLESQRDRINKHLAHLTWQRLSDGTPSWEREKITSAVFSVAEEWARFLSPRHPDLGAAFAGRVSRARQHVASGGASDL